MPLSVPHRQAYIGRRGTSTNSRPFGVALTGNRYMSPPPWRSTCIERPRHDSFYLDPEHLRSRVYATLHADEHPSCPYPQTARAEVGCARDVRRRALPDGCHLVLDSGRPRWAWVAESHHPDLPVERDEVCSHGPDQCGVFAPVAASPGGRT